MEKGVIKMRKDKSFALFIGLRLQRARDKTGLTQEQVGDTLGVDKHTVGGYELGRRFPPYTTLKQLTALYGISLDWLFGLTEEDIPDIDMRNFFAVQWDQLSADDRNFLRRIVKQAIEHHADKMRRNGLEQK
jgi:transcriptional regulator with XRE-family HTH domain